VYVNKSGIYFGYVLEKSGKIFLLSEINFCEFVTLLLETSNQPIVQKLVSHGDEKIYTLGLEAKYKEQFEHIQKLKNQSFHKNFIELSYEIYEACEQRVVKDPVLGNPNTDILIDMLESLKQSLLVIFDSEYEKKRFEEYLKDNTRTPYESLAKSYMEQWEMNYPDTPHCTVKQNKYSDKLIEALKNLVYKDPHILAFKNYFTRLLINQEITRQVFEVPVVCESPVTFWIIYIL